MSRRNAINIVLNTFIRVTMLSHATSGKARATISPSWAILLKLRRFFFYYFHIQELKQKSTLAVCGCGGSAKKKNPIKSNGLRTLSPATIHTCVLVGKLNTCSHFSFSAGSHIFVVRRHTLSRLKKKIHRLDLNGVVNLSVIRLLIYYLKLLFFLGKEILMNLFRTETASNARYKYEYEMICKIMIIVSRASKRKLSFMRLLLLTRRFIYFCLLFYIYGWMNGWM